MIICVLGQLYDSALVIDRSIQYSRNALLTFEDAVIPLHVS